MSNPYLTRLLLYRYTPEQAHVIEIIPNSLLTNDLIETVSVKGGFFEPSIENDWLKIRSY